MSNAPIYFNKPRMAGKELEYIRKAVESGHLSGDGTFTAACTRYFEERYRIGRAMLTTSGTDALEMIALLLDVKPGDRIIMPSYNFVSAANAFMLRGAELVFADSTATHPNVDPESVAQLITPRTKAVLCVHYAGMSCNMDALQELASSRGIMLVEDAAHAIESKWKDEKQLGTIGQLGAYSFHETKNITSGEGGMLAINDPQFNERAAIIRHKGTNRDAFFGGKVSKYEWVDIGSSFLPSELNAAFLLAQAEQIESIQQQRTAIWDRYYNALAPLGRKGCFSLQEIPEGAQRNGHLFYIVCNSMKDRDGLIAHLKERKIQAVFHYQSLHSSPFFHKLHDGRKLPNADRYTACLLRLPLYFDLTIADQQRITDAITEFYVGY